MTDELLRELLDEVRALRKEVASLRDVASDDMRQFCINVAADAFWETIEEADKAYIKDKFKKQ